MEQHSQFGGGQHNSKKKSLGAGKGADKAGKRKRLSSEVAETDRKGISKDVGREKSSKNSKRKKNTRLGR